MFEKIPALDYDNKAFWTSGKNNELRICHCPKCKTYQHPPLPVCPNCRHTEIEYIPVSGNAKVISFTINYQPWAADQIIPFVLAIVELEEQKGLWLMTNIVDCAPEDVVIDMEVSVRFENEEDIWLPVFRPKGKNE